jgi:nucleoside-triphosphatase THEP1
MSLPNNNTLSPTWQKATIIGSVWGAFEIVAGSILHNLAVPLVAGTALSVLGVLIMVSGARIFGGKGIFWRSALVCAALKTVSPSPVILSPMIGITLEGLLMETGVIIFGYNLAGFILGGGLAVLSILGFKFVRLIMIYGTDIVEAYKSVFSFAFSNDLLSLNGYLFPILVIVIIYLIIGALTSYLGFHSGKAIRDRFERKNIQIIPMSSGYKPPIVKGYKGGIGFLLFHAVWLIAFIGLKNLLPSVFWISGGILYLALCVFRYGRVRLVMSKPMFWMVIVIVSSISTIFVQLGKSGEFYFNAESVLYSTLIILRAMVVIISFAAIGIEVRSKGVSSHFGMNRFAPLAESFSHAHNALPGLLWTLKTESKLLYKPLPLIERMFSHFTSQDLEKSVVPNIYIVTADKQGGKTTFIKGLIAFVESSDVEISGFYAEGLWGENGERAGFNLITLPEKHSVPLCDRTSTQWLNYGVYYFNPLAIELGRQILNNVRPESLVFIDEIGVFELEDKLWATSFSSILNQQKNTIVLTVRRMFLEDVLKKWNLSNTFFIDVSTDHPENAGKAIISRLKNK